jgi:hypothetical protein
MSCPRLDGVVVSLSSKDCNKVAYWTANAGDGSKF